MTLDSGEEIALERIGKGMFHVCYLDPARNQVYSITIERPEGSDYSKEILSRCAPNPHIPRVERMEDFGPNDNRRVYRMPRYWPIVAKEHPAAWNLLKRLQQAGQDAWTAILREQGLTGWGKPKMRIEDIGHMVNARVCELMEAPGVPQELGDALEELADTANEYGACYVFEFSKRNCMVDGKGNLILLDVLFSLETVEAMRKARTKKHTGW